MAEPFTALWRTASFIWSHPLGRRQRLRSFARLAAWQLYGRWQRQPRAMPWVNGLVLATTPGMTGATGNLYVGLHEWPDMPFVLHLLRPGDHLLDVGSNVGTYALLAAGGCGAHVTAIEPTKAALTGLRRHIAINHLDHLISVHEVCTRCALVQPLARCASAKISAP